VEFEVVVMPDGKLRARELSLISTPNNGTSVVEPPPPPPRHTADDRVSGRIIKFDRTKGYGFISCVHGEMEDIFFLSSALPKDIGSYDNLLDMDVEVETTTNEEGKPRAIRVWPVRPASSQPWRSSDARGSWHEGVLCAFDPVKGFGFLKPDGMGEDVFFLRTELPPEIRDAQRREQVVDTRVAFEMITVPDGKLRAQRLSLVASRKLPMPPPLPPGPPVLVGVIRKFDFKRGYGFISCDGQSEDVFFLSGALPKDLQETRQLEGLEVTFEVVLNDEGKTRAHHVRRLEPSSGASSVSESRTYTGAIITFEPNKGFGFIQCDDFSEDVFYLRSEMPEKIRDCSDRDSVIGQNVQFEVRTMPDGKFRARHIHLLTSSRHDHGRRAHGKILRYDRGRGYGFIGSSVHPDNIFFLRTSLPKDVHYGSDLKDLQVSFEFSINEEGKPRANHILFTERMGGSQCSSTDERKRPVPPPWATSTGTIVRYDFQKAYGFVAPDDISEDVFFLKAEMPSELWDSRDVLHVRVEFELKTMPDGKMRAQRMKLLSRQDRD